MDWNSSKLHLLLHYLHYVVKRASRDRLTVNAGYLAYITLLSLVPLATVVLSALSTIPAFSGTGDVIQDFIFQNFVPAAGEVVQSTLNEFVANTTKMTTIGAIFLFVAALLLISGIDKNLNFIWRTQKKRPLIYSFSLYWMVLTLGPILMGGSLVISSHVASLKILSEDAVSFLYQGIPVIFTFFAFLGLYMFVPNIKVKFKHALAGAITAGGLFEITKVLFALYITQFPSYQLIYGALSAVPIIFVWIYLCWFIVLIGAEITASLGESEKWNLEQRYDATWFINTTNKLKLRGKSVDSTDTKGD
jgi:membrane protein